ncbi:heavy metal translocating P-type ATPase [Biformimicrobium ophioploci]|uniref:Heavy metal translocating P-type ATPase n=1 Tax=Biformimicrobium ophioploci TaxID=3036711 RepID=A0ABQ6LXP8_9GAMM|nr:heavy metal translocating P-type ATPase [Microbulbifer sp. NKW57]GMG86806.1 heavy metal translocating P-type ATPase [Microbulbifer sp. NKW57]
MTTTAQLSMSASNDCYHCGLPVPEGSNFSVVIEGQPREMCCPGCEAVAGAIVSGGLENFYRYREQSAERPTEESADERWQAYDLEAVQKDFVSSLGDGGTQVRLLVGGITCAACVWLIEQHLGALPGVRRVVVNASTHRAQILIDPATVKVSRVMQSLAEIGYRPVPATAANREQLLQQESRTALRRLGVAGLGTMQVMMFSIALYAGGFESDWGLYLRLVSLLVATPVVFYAARPFFEAAWRALKKRSLVMDVPVSLAIGGAYAASLYATVTGRGEVYFDSVSMFTFFLLLGRTIEMRARHKAGLAAGGLAQLLPLTASRVEEPGSGEPEEVPVASLQVGNVVLIRPGSVIPCDGEVRQGSSAVNESCLSGEELPVRKETGDLVAAGTVNTESPLWLSVHAVGEATRLSAIERLVEQAQADKPAQVAMADRLARWFVAAVLVTATLVFGVWWQIDSERALWITLSVLVVTCPCALALATPTALTAATNRMRELGLLVSRGHVLEQLPQITKAVFDKTGTLTAGEPSVQAFEALTEGIEEQQALAICAALEASSHHPIARAFVPWCGQVTAADCETVTGAGVSGRVGGTYYKLGKPEFAAGAAMPSPQAPLQWMLLASDSGPLAWIGLGDRQRSGAPEAIALLRQQGLEPSLLSGDQSAHVARLAHAVGIEHYTAGVSPEQKLEQVRALQAAGERVLMVGDGINDVPVLSGADISVAMAGASDLAQTRADAVLLAQDLRVLPEALRLAQRCRRIIRQNLSWALLYNLLALPLAVAGLVPPWAAAIGMSASSLVVVLNALRLSR